MGYKIYALLICSILVVSSGCQEDAASIEAAKSDKVINQQSDKVSGPLTPLEGSGETCGLVEASEIASLQGEKIIEAQPSSQKSDTFIVNQCYYVAAENAKSVVLSVYRVDPDNPAGRRPKEFWQERFSKPGKADEGDDESKDKPSGKKEKWNPPVSVEGLGDQAYWLDNKLGGALYVLRGDEFLRISVGGTSDAELRISKAKSIAEAALKRL